MRTVTIEVSTLEESLARFEKAWNGEKQGEFISFASIEQLWKTLTPRRMQLLQTMTGKEPMSLRALARLDGRDVKTVHGDAHALLGVGILDRADDGKLVFPYDAIHVDFMVKNAA